jgi:hypothetical protein
MLSGIIEFNEKIRTVFTGSTLCAYVQHHSLEKYIACLVFSCMKCQELSGGEYDIKLFSRDCVNRNVTSVILFEWELKRNEESVALSAKQYA